MKKKFIILMLVLSLGLSGCVGINLNGNIGYGFDNSRGNVYLSDILGTNPHIRTNITIR